MAENVAYGVGGFALGAVVGGVTGYMLPRPMPQVYPWALRELNRVRIEVLNPDTGEVMYARKPLPEHWYAKPLAVFRLGETEWVVMGVEDSATPGEEVDFVDVVIKLSWKRGEDYFVIDGVSCTGWYPKRVYYDDTLLLNYRGYYSFNAGVEYHSPHFELPPTV